MPKQNVLFVQVNYRYGTNVFLPYSIGLLQAYAETLPEVRENFRFLEPIYLRETPADVVLRIERPAVACFSSYIWNWEYNKALARLLKMAFPECLIVFGGTQVPGASNRFFEEHPYVDLLVHQEGEFVFADVLCELNFSSRPDFTKIGGLSVRVEGNRTIKTAQAKRIGDLSKLPSPYLSGIFDFMLERGYALNATQETNRGCPYSCTFCDWGGNTMSKLFEFDEDRIREEYEWMGKHKVEYLFSGDANWGILKRDFKLTELMIATREKHGGFPRKFRMCTAKNSNDKIFTIAKMLNEAGMSKGATLSFQSMDEKTLGIVKRRNIKLEVFSHLMDRYRAENIPTYTELIMGMPGETYESTKKGIDRIFEGHADSVNLNAYVCTMLPNSKMSEPLYISLNKIKSVRMPILLGHSTPGSGTGNIIEYENVVVETASMSNTDWQRTYLFYWMVQAFHCLCLTQYIAILFRRHFGVEYSDFYEKMIEYFGASQKTLVGKEIALIRSIIARSVEGGRIDLVLQKFGNIYWPLEEASFLTLVTEKGEFYREIRSFIGLLAGISGRQFDDVLLDDVVLYQLAVVRDPYTTRTTIGLSHDLHGYFGDLKSGSEPPKSSSRLLIKTDREFGGDLEKFAREIVWYGRKGGSFRHTDITRDDL